MLFFFFIGPATSEIYTLSLHDALPISWFSSNTTLPTSSSQGKMLPRTATTTFFPRSEEHTSELQSRVDLVCRLLLEKKKEKEAEVHRTKNYDTALPCAHPLPYR